MPDAADAYILYCMAALLEHPLRGPLCWRVKLHAHLLAQK